MLEMVNKYPNIGQPPSFFHLHDFILLVLRWVIKKVQILNACRFLCVMKYAEHENHFLKKWGGGCYDDENAISHPKTDAFSLFVYKHSSF